jgi:hypothetical protein
MRGREKRIHLFEDFADFCNLLWSLCDGSLVGVLAYLLCLRHIRVNSSLFSAWRYVSPRIWLNSGTRKHAAYADATIRRADSNKTEAARWAANRNSGVGTQTAKAEARGYRDPRSTR